MLLHLLILATVFIQDTNKIMTLNGPIHAELKEKGFSAAEIEQLLVKNPAEAMKI